MNESSRVKNFTRGGQITLHNVRMFLQIMDKVTWVALAVFLSVSISMSWMTTTEYERYVVEEFVWAISIPLLNPNATTPFIQPNGNVTTVSFRDINSSPFVKEMVRQTTIKLIRALLAGLITAIISVLGVSYWLRKLGQKQTEDNLLRGDRIALTQETKKLILSKKIDSNLSLAGLPLIRDMETAHIFFHGTTGSGKSNAIKELLDQIRQRGDRVIVYDKSCNYLEEFYDPRQDYLLNPLDERGLPWDLWLECRDAADFDSLAAAQIPMPNTQDPFWVNAARTIFAAAAHEMRNDEDRSISKLMRYLLTADLAVMQKYLKGTEAETLVSDKIEKTAVSIKSVLATYLKSLKYVKDGKNPFSIRRWIQDEKEKNWLFITSLGDRHETLKPLISSWIDIAVNALLSLSPNTTRRIWLILDELTSLQPLPYLTQTLSESRKFGGCIVIGIQNYAQLAKLYSQDGAREISSLLNTRFIFRQPDPDMARWSANNFGESILDEVREGISYGANTMRDGVSINRVEVKKALVSYSEIMSLANLSAYVRLPGKFPITNVSFHFKKRARRNIGLLERTVDQQTDKVIESPHVDAKSTAKPFPEKTKKTAKENKKTKETSTTVQALDM